MNDQAPGRGVALSLAFVATLFFGWGFVTSVIDPLVASVKGVFQLTFAEAMLTQFAWFIAYGVVSLPAAAILARVGYSRAILIALATMVAGCVGIPLATLVDSYPGVLIGLFVIASGVTLLQVAANPLAANLGSSEGSHFRLTLVQAFNSLGTVLGPLLGATIMLSGGVFAVGAAGDHAADRAESLRAIDTAFLIIAGFFVALGVFIFFVRKRLEKAGGVTEATSPFAAFRSGWALAGAAAIFLYVGSEVTIGSMLTNFLAGDDVLGLSLERAGQMVALYWLGAMIGRFIGSVLLARLSAGWLLAGVAAVAAGLCLVVTQLTGPIAGYLALAVGLFNAIMFPTIFTLTLERSSAPAAATSGLLCMAIVGGAVLPYIAGRIADATGSIHVVFFVPLAGYLGILLFAILAARKVASAPVAAPLAGH